MSKGKARQVYRCAKEALRRLDYVASKQVLKELVKWSDSQPERKAKESTHLTVAERIRFKYWLVWKYGAECGYCHKQYDWRHALTIDHIQPKSKGGAVRDIRNMVLACRGCNMAKGDDWLT